MPLVTLDDVKTFMGIPLIDTSKDAVLTMFKESVEQAVINFCDTDFSPKVVTGEVLDAVRSDIIVPKNCPIISVQKVILHNDMDGANGIELDAKQWNHDDNAITLRDMFTPFSRGMIRVDYTWGYASVPADVKMVVYQSVKAEYQRHKANTENIGSRSKGDESESFGTGANGAWDPYTGLPKQIVAKLQAYKVYEIPLVNMAQRNL
jgi:hypothetical protein